MNTCLTSAFFRDYPFHTSANSEAGIGVLERLADEPPLSGFFTSVAWPHPFMGGSCGEPKGSPVQSRYANPHESAHPIGVGRAENLNRFDWSHIMPKAPKRALAPVLKLVPAPSKPNPKDNPRSKECFNKFVELMSEAHKGELIGIAFVAMYEGGGYVVNAIGEFDACPTYARGCVKALDDYLKDKVHE